MDKRRGGGLDKSRAPSNATLDNAEQQSGSGKEGMRSRRRPLLSRRNTSSVSSATVSPASSLTAVNSTVAAAAEGTGAPSLSSRRDSNTWLSSLRGLVRRKNPATMSSPPAFYYGAEAAAGTALPPSQTQQNRTILDRRRRRGSHDLLGQTLSLNLEPTRQHQQQEHQQQRSPHRVQSQQAQQACTACVPAAAWRANALTWQPPRSGPAPAQTPELQSESPQDFLWHEDFNQPSPDSLPLGTGRHWSPNELKPRSVSMLPHGRTPPPTPTAATASAADCAACCPRSPHHHTVATATAAAPCKDAARNVSSIAGATTRARGRTVGLGRSCSSGSLSVGFLTEVSPGGWGGGGTAANGAGVSHTGSCIGICASGPICGDTVASTLSDNSSMSPSGLPLSAFHRDSGVFEFPEVVSSSASEGNSLTSHPSPVNFRPGEDNSTMMAAGKARTSPSASSAAMTAVATVACSAGDQSPRCHDSMSHSSSEHRAVRRSKSAEPTLTNSTTGVGRKTASAQPSPLFLQPVKVKGGQVAASRAVVFAASPETGADVANTKKRSKWSARLPFGRGRGRGAIARTRSTPSCPMCQRDVSETESYTDAAHEQVSNQGSSASTTAQEQDPQQQQEVANAASRQSSEQLLQLEQRHSHKSTSRLHRRLNKDDSGFLSSVSSILSPSNSTPAGGASRRESTQSTTATAQQHGAAIKTRSHGGQKASGGHSRAFISKRGGSRDRQSSFDQTHGPTFYQPSAVVVNSSVNSNNSSSPAPSVCSELTSRSPGGSSVTSGSVGGCGGGGGSVFGTTSSLAGPPMSYGSNSSGELTCDSGGDMLPLGPNSAPGPSSLLRSCISEEMCELVITATADTAAAAASLPGGFGAIPDEDARASCADPSDMAEDRTTVSVCPSTSGPLVAATSRVLESDVLNLFSNVDYVQLLHGPTGANLVHTDPAARGELPLPCSAASVPRSLPELKICASGSELDASACGYESPLAQRPSPTTTTDGSTPKSPFDDDGKNSTKELTEGETRHVRSEPSLALPQVRIHEQPFPAMLDECLSSRDELATISRTPSTDSDLAACRKVTIATRSISSPSLKPACSSRRSGTYTAATSKAGGTVSGKAPLLSASQIRHRSLSGSTRRRVNRIEKGVGSLPNICVAATTGYPVDGAVAAGNISPKQSRAAVLEKTKSHRSDGVQSFLLRKLGGLRQLRSMSPPRHSGHDANDGASLERSVSSTDALGTATAAKPPSADLPLMTPTPAQATVSLAPSCDGSSGTVDSSTGTQHGGGHPRESSTVADTYMSPAKGQTAGCDVSQAGSECGSGGSSGGGFAGVRSSARGSAGSLSNDGRSRVATGGSLAGSRRVRRDSVGNLTSKLGISTQVMLKGRGPRLAQKALKPFKQKLIANRENKRTKETIFSLLNSPYQYDPSIDMSSFDGIELYAETDPETDTSSESEAEGLKTVASDVLIPCVFTLAEGVSVSLENSTELQDFPQLPMSPLYRLGSVAQINVDGALAEQDLAGGDNHADCIPPTSACGAELSSLSLLEPDAVSSLPNAVGDLRSRSSVMSAEFPDYDLSVPLPTLGRRLSRSPLMPLTMDDWTMPMTISRHSSVIFTPESITQSFSWHRRISSTAATAAAAAGNASLPDASLPNASLPTFGCTFGIADTVVTTLLQQHDSSEWSSDHQESSEDERDGSYATARGDTTENTDYDDDGENDIHKSVDTLLKAVRSSGDEEHHHQAIGGGTVEWTTSLLCNPGYLSSRNSMTSWQQQRSSCSTASRRRTSSQDSLPSVPPSLSRSFRRPDSKYRLRYQRQSAPAVSTIDPGS
ncbi:uncharacterized protein LOC135829488 [Sycon ciliatum]|uniref:uncharacterized protein LOC135829488 n=1 Tax=Sycon ciliatum TaxID=27933 RepID=UPI0031F6DBC2